MNPNDPKFDDLLNLPFIPGVDQGLKHWLEAKNAVREARNRGGNHETIPVNVPYKYYNFWLDQLYDLSFDELNHLVKLPPNEEAKLKFSWKNDTIPLNDFENYLLEPATHIESIMMNSLSHRGLGFLKRLKIANIDLNTTFGIKRRTLLHLACLFGDIEKVEYLLAQGVRINCVDIDNATPLHLSIKLESFFHPIKIAELLLSHKADTNALDKFHRTSLHYACIIQNPHYVNLLLKYKALMYVKDISEKMPIEFTGKMKIKKIFEHYAFEEGQRVEYSKMQSRLLARHYFGDILKLAQPSCHTCKRTIPCCELFKKKNYRHWMYCHNKLQNEITKKDVVDKNSS